MTTKTWDYERYWNAVLGDGLSARQVVLHFGLTADRVELDDWLGHAEDAACDAAGLECDSDEVAQWDPFHARAIDELHAAARILLQPG